MCRELDDRLDQLLVRLGPGAELILRPGTLTPNGERVVVEWTRIGKPGRRIDFAYSVTNAIDRVNHAEDEIDAAATPAATVEGEQR